MLLEPCVSDVLTTEENRSHCHGKAWKWEGKWLHATPAPCPAQPLISPSCPAQALLPRINGHCAEPPARGEGSREASAFLLPLPSLAGGAGAKFALAAGQQPAES